MPRYSAAARLLHWFVVVVVAVIAVLGIWITQFEPADEAFKLRLYNIHESLGVVIFVTMLVRLVGRQLNPPPPLPEGTAAAAKLGSHAVHLALYAVLLVQPVIGFIGTNAWGFPLSVFNILPLPAPVAASDALGEVMSAIHWWLALALAGLLTAHLGGVVVHMFVWKDRLLRRMW
jgi:cytochrome b561